MAEDSSRDRIRALVRDVLSKIPSEQTGESVPEPAKTTRFIDMAPEDSSMKMSPVTRDESSKMVITEDDVRGLDAGSVLRIGQSARMTPLAADIVKEKQIELVRRAPRRGSGASRTIAVGADHGGFKMKESLKLLLAEMGHRVHDFGTD